MKRHSNQKLAVAAIAAQWVASVNEIARAVSYIRAAHRDERDGFRYTAAIEWRHAAELFTWNTYAVEYCWREWERIMNLPRHFAVPIADPPPLAANAAA